ncbi:MAG: MucR family transcriptional regulator [Proteobacteria bacterium]|nr:MucR family transcriptional regulator [Pseudomonadota bacterium]
MNDAEDKSQLASSQRLSAIVMARTGEIISAFVSHNALPIDQLETLIKSVHAALCVVNGAPLEASEAKPAVPVRKSITPDHLVCLEDGKKLKMLKRYLRARYQLSPEEYRAKWSLPLDYPMVAPNYSAQRSLFAKRIGLGRTSGRAKQRRAGV